MGLMFFVSAICHGPNISASTANTSLQNSTTFESRQAVEVYNKVKDSVVRIDVIGQEANEKITINGKPLQTAPFEATGSGFFYDSRGKIVTNYHVVEKTTKVVAILANGNRYPGKVIGVDPVNDLAVIQIDEHALFRENLQPLPIADPSTFQIGQSVVAIGSPYFYSNSLSQGIISQIDRTGLDVKTGTILVGGFIQTDTAITHGNSGGPLLNMNGELVGVNDWIEVDPTSGTQVPGLGFAISSSIVKRVIPQLILNGKYSYPWMGIGIEDIGPFAAKRIGLNETRGVTVLWVTPGSPAELSGIMYGDVILKADAHNIKEKSDIVGYLSTKKPGDIVSLNIFRSNESNLDIPVKIGVFDNSNATAY
jgi:S1-C subfamily serine protease